MLIDRETLSLMICTFLVLLAIEITLHLAFKALNQDFGHNPDDALFLDSDGNHAYYERSLITKLRFLRDNPNFLPSQIRSLKLLLKTHFHRSPRFSPN